MKPYAPPNAAEKIRNERTAKVSHGWRRVNRRMCNFIRKARPIPMTLHLSCRALSRRRRWSGDLAKCLRLRGAAPGDKNVVDKALKGDFQSDAAARRRCPPRAPTMSAAASRGVKVFDRTKIR